MSDNFLMQMTFECFNYIYSACIAFIMFSRKGRAYVLADMLHRLYSAHQVMLHVHRYVLMNGRAHVLAYMK